MAKNQLDTLLKYESDKERQASQQLQKAEHEYQQNLLRLKSVGEYRLEYMKRLEMRSMQGIDSATYSHFHGFIAKLDQAGEQVTIAISQSKALVEKSRTAWLLQRQKVQAVEKLRNKQREKLALIAEKNEQKMFDEIATQQFIRRNY